MANEINLARDPYAPNFRLLVNGDELPKSISKFIGAVEYEDNANMCDKLSFTVGSQMVVEGSQIMTMLDQKIFTEGNLIEVEMGYGSKLSPVGAGEVVKIKPSFPRDGLPSLQIEAYDISHRMIDSKPEKGISYKNFRDSQIASIIGERNGIYIAKSDPSTFEYIRKTEGVHDRFQEKNKNDYEFLKKIADFNSYDFYVRYMKVAGTKRWVLFFRPSDKKQEPIYTYTYNMSEKFLWNTLLDFNPDLNTKDQKLEFEVTSFNKKEGKKVKTVTRDVNKKFTYNEGSKEYSFKEKEERQFKGTDKYKPIKKEVRNPGQIKFKAFGVSREIIANEPVRDEKDAERIIQKWMQARKDNFVTGPASVVGTEFLQSRQVHRFEGIGKGLSGNYFFTKVLHKMDVSGSPVYECSVDCSKVVD